MKSLFTYAKLTLIIVFIYSCKVNVQVNLPTDNFNTSSDDLLIKYSFSEKIQVYQFPKSLYKNSDRKKSLKQIEDLSKKALANYQAGSLNELNYNKLANEAKYVVQHAMYLMRDETSLPTGSDTINDYLKTGINSLNDILRNSKN